jgi:hypothetical protein
MNADGSRRLTYLIDTAQQFDKRAAAQCVNKNKKTTIHYCVGAEVKLLQRSVHEQRFRYCAGASLANVIVPKIKRYQVVVAAQCSGNAELMIG